MDFNILDGILSNINLNTKNIENIFFNKDIDIDIEAKAKIYLNSTLNITYPELDENLVHTRKFDPNVSNTSSIFTQSVFRINFR